MEPATEKCEGDMAANFFGLIMCEYIVTPLRVAKKIM